MKIQLLSLLFPVLLFSCMKSPARYDNKTLPENTYVENRKDRYTLHHHPGAGERVLVTNHAGDQPLDLTRDQVTLSGQIKRPFFKIVSQKDTVVVANRRIDFKNINNFRDIGGLQTANGKVVRWGMIFRSEQLAHLEKSDFDKFIDLQIETVYDLRTTSEIKNNKDQLPENVTYHHIQTVKDNGDLLTRLRSKLLRGEITEEQSLKMITDLYQNMVTADLASLKDLLRNILSADTPVLFHCSAGKDRTGVVTALILSILHVDRKTVFEEYMMSNYYRRNKLKKILTKAKLAKAIKPKINLHVIENFMRVDEKYLSAVFDVIDNQYGGTDLFIKNQLKIDEQDRQQMIDKFTYSDNK